MERLLPYIDWDPFFSSWQIRGKYPNRTYPKIFNDKSVGEEAQKLFNSAQTMLRKIIDNKWLEARGVLGFYPANAVNHDDIELYTDDSKSQVACKLFTLRQQLDRDQESFVAMADFVAPQESGVTDYVGMFAVSAGFKQE